MTTFAETPIPCPYIVGAKFRLQVSPPDGMPYEAQATVTHVFAPFTVSPVMKVYLEPQGFVHLQEGFPSELVFKVYDRRFALSIRARHRIKPPTFKSESVYRQYVQSGNAPQGLAAINTELSAHCLHGIGNAPSELVEHWLTARTAPHFESECAAYNRLASLQGQYIPRFYGSTCFLDEPNPDVDGLDPSVLGILLEFVPGISLEQIDPTSVNLDNLLRSALNIVEIYSEMGVLNRDARLGNMIVKPDGTGVVMIDFAQSRLRGPEETDEEWKRAKWSEDEEGRIGYIGQWEFKWNYVPTYKYLVPADPEDDNR